MARAVKVTFKEFRTLYSTEDACRAELFRLRFPNGFVCPVCGCTEYDPVRGWNTFQCRSCRRQTSVTAGTVIHRTHLPLTVWFWAIYAISNLKTFLLATSHGRCAKLQAYLDEFCFRFNRRMTGNQIFLHLTRAVATSCGMLR